VLSYINERIYPEKINVEGVYFELDMKKNAKIEKKLRNIGTK